MADMEKAQERHAAGAVGEMNDPDHKHPTGIPDHHQDLAAQIAAMSPEEYAELDRRVLWKMDKNIIPWITYVHTTTPHETWASGLAAPDLRVSRRQRLHPACSTL